MKPTTDHFKRTAAGEDYAGDHLLVEFWGACNLTDPGAIREALESSARAAGATLLHSHYHSFGDGGVSGVSVLAESHITIHTWPARGYAAIDIFMCGGCDPVDCLPEQKHRLSPRRIEHQTIRRGRCRPPAGTAQDVA
jgi:S-adenosylmethionine decarboxylase